MMYSMKYTFNSDLFICCLGINPVFYLTNGKITHKLKSLTEHRYAVQLHDGSVSLHRESMADD